MTVGITALCDGRSSLRCPARTSAARRRRGLTGPRRQSRGAFAAYPVLVMHVGGLTSAQLLPLAGVFGEPQVQLLEGYRISDTPSISIIASDQTDSTGRWPPDRIRRPLAHRRQLPRRPRQGHDAVRPRHPGRGWRHPVRRHDSGLRSTRARRAPNSGACGPSICTSPGGTSRRSHSISGEEAETPPVEHPLVRTHPDTGRRSLYLNPNRMDTIVGLDEDASDACSTGSSSTRPRTCWSTAMCGSATTWCCGTTAEACTVQSPTTATTAARRIASSWHGSSSCPPTTAHRRLRPQRLRHHLTTIRANAIARRSRARRSDLRSRDAHRTVAGAEFDRARLAARLRTA